MNSEQKICKNKKCQKVLPEGYKHRYCEACRGKYAQTTKGALAAAGSVGLIALSVVTGKKLSK